ncbi:uncharacterized protein LOC108049579 [Drosophila rhopaloa]|uniref:Uncharacterized protein LOC108049579 n=1 Tax=Drosophila rhopaloa TaxID=1041015 RepID=A0A6P4FB12_DRORH|nr:uncharacterized protein LOC108049579 [Drosophila rhopaloa]
MNWLALGLLLLSVSFTMALEENTPYICDGKDDRVCDQFRCMCRRRSTTRSDLYYPTTTYDEF